MWNAGLHEAQEGIMIARRNINNLRYTDESPLWQKVKRKKRAFDEDEEESEKAGLKVNI